MVKGGAGLNGHPPQNSGQLHIVIPEIFNSNFSMGERLIEEIARKNPGTTDYHALVIYDDGRGVTNAWNRAIAQSLPCTGPASRNDKFILLNNDIIVEGPFIEYMRHHMDEFAIVGCATRTETALGGRDKSLNPWSNLEKPLWLQGWCMGFRADLWERLGGFDESMKLYFSDLDYQVRAMQLGADIIDIELPLRHIGQQTSKTLPNKRALWAADRATFIAKYWGGA